MSLTITATRNPARLDNTWFSSVVFPDPRKPESTVTGSFLAIIFNLTWNFSKPDGLSASQTTKRRRVVLSKLSRRM